MKTCSRNCDKCILGDKTNEPNRYFCWDSERFVYSIKEIEKTKKENVFKNFKQKVLTKIIKKWYN